MSALTFTPGKFYRTRDGQKYEPILTGLRLNGTDQTGMIGVVHCADGSFRPVNYFSDGCYWGKTEHGLDLIAEWSDAPEIDWSKMPEGANHVTIDEDGEARAWEQQPRPLNRFWTAVRGRSWKLYPQHVPKWSGDWRDSLVTREGAQP